MLKVRYFKNGLVELQRSCNMRLKMDTSWTQSEKVKCVPPKYTFAGGNPAVK